MKVRNGVLSTRKKGIQNVNATDVKAIITTAQAANNVPALKQAVADLATLVGKLAEASGFTPKTQ